MPLKNVITPIEVSVMPLKNKKRLVKDIVDIMKQPLNNEGIYYKHSDTNMNLGYAMIIGPEDTIYEYGYYFFKFKFKNTYPYEPPEVTFHTFDGKTRFNPNLYIDGKVCISLLNTWTGEQWTSCQTIRSILITLISLLHNKPLLNEPNITELHSDFKRYNEIIEFRNIQIAIIDVINGKNFDKDFFIFLDEILETFSKNKPKIINKTKKLRDKYIKEHKEDEIGIYQWIGKKNISTKTKVVKTSIYRMYAHINYNVLWHRLKIMDGVSIKKETGKKKEVKKKVVKKKVVKKKVVKKKVVKKESKKNQ